VPSIDVSVTITAIPRDVSGGIVIVTQIADPGSPSVTTAEASTSKEATENGERERERERC
jgi:hypothetical protein